MCRLAVTFLDSVNSKTDMWLFWSLGLKWSLSLFVRVLA